MSVHFKLRACLVRILIAPPLLSSILFAQMASWNVAEQDLGRPARPPFISFLGIAAPGQMAIDASLRPKGPVAEVLFEELRVGSTPSGPAGEVIETIKCKYDAQGRVVEE